MAWRLSTRTTNDIQEYRVYSTISDEFLTEWISKKDVEKFIFWQYFNDFIQKFVETCTKFPDGWTDVDSGMRNINKEAREKWSTMLRKSIDSDEIIDSAFVEKLQEIGIDVQIIDEEFKFNSKND